MSLRKVIKLSSDIDGMIEMDSFAEAKKVANENIKKGIRTSIYIDYFRGEEDTDPVKGSAYFTNDECTRLYKSKY